MTILCTGDSHSVLAKAIKEILYNVDFVSRTHNNIDLTKNYDIDKFINMSQQYDVIINCARLTNYGQSILLSEMWIRWHTWNKQGHIINIGSDILYKIGTSFLHNPNISYVLEKQALANAHKKYCLMDPNIKMTLVQPGRMEILHMSPHYVASIIEWVLQQPPSININEIVISEK